MTRYTPLWLQAGSYPAGVDRRLIAAIWPAAVVSGCAVTLQSVMNVNVAAGWVVVPAANNSGSVLCVSDAVEVVGPLATLGAGTNRIDLIVCSVTSTDIGTTAGGAFSFGVVAGAPSASPVAPAVPAGSTVIAQVLVIGGQATIQAGNITDRRNPAAPRDTLHARVSRAATGILATSFVPFAYDTVERTLAGLYSIANQQFTVPVAGLYVVAAVVYVYSTGTGQGIATRLTKNGTSVGSHGQAFSSAASQGLTSVLTNTVLCAAGSRLQVLAQSTPALSTQFPDPTLNFATIDYAGTG